jgi:hypothetical protein
LYFYIIDIKDSNEYAKMYTKLEKNAVNTEYPEFVTNTNNSTTKVCNYFELEAGMFTYDLFLVADFEADRYYLKISERPENDNRL